MIHLDTHVVVWLYEGRTERLSPRAAQLIETQDLQISPLVRLELEFLAEIGRIAEGGATVVEDLRRRIGLLIAGAPLDAVTARAAPLSWTRDPFDRLIVAHSLLADVPLLTRDRAIRDHAQHAIWD